MAREPPEEPAVLIHQQVAGDALVLRLHPRHGLNLFSEHVRPEVALDIVHRFRLRLLQLRHVARHQIYDPLAEHDACVLDLLAELGPQVLGDFNCLRQRFVLSQAFETAA